MKASLLRIVLVPSAYYPHIGGIEETTRQLALAFNEAGHNATVLTARWPEGVRGYELLDGIEVTRMAFPLPAARASNAMRFAARAPAAGHAFVTHIRRAQPDVVHVIGAGPQSVYAVMLRRLLRARLVFTGQGELTFDAEDVFAGSATLRMGLRQMLHRADAVTACSAYVLETLKEFGRVSGPSEVIPNGVNPEDFAERRELNEALGGYVFAAGRLVPQKGFDVLLDALADLPDEELTLVIAGEGTERPRLERQATALGLTHRVRFLGALDRDALALWLRGAHVFAFPSRGEPFGIALLESMAAGVPAVATATGGVTEFARDGQNALLVPVDDAAALAGALMRLREDQPLRNLLKAGGRATANRLTWRNIAAHYEGVYRHALQGHGA